MNKKGKEKPKEYFKNFQKPGGANFIYGRKKLCLTKARGEIAREGWLNGPD